MIWIAALAQTGAGAEARDAPEIKPPPSMRAPCSCPEQNASEIVILQGLAVDAEARLGPDGRTPSDMQATIFDIISASRGAYSGRMKIWHSTDTNKCGVRFDYGRRYAVAARENEDGALETDKCIMRAAANSE